MTLKQDGQASRATVVSLSQDLYLITESVRALCHVFRQFCSSEWLLVVFDWLTGMCLRFEVLRAGKRAADVCVATRLSADRTGGRTAGGIIAESIIQ